MTDSIRLVKGVGLSLPGKYYRNHTIRAYKSWALMLERCYVPSSKNTTYYKRVSVCKEWLEYQAFADWYYKQKGCELKWEIDKDLIPLSTDNVINVYSPENCVLLPKELNLHLKGSYKSKKDSLPYGVFNYKDTGKFIVQCRFNKTLVYLGIYTDLTEAMKVAIFFKQEVLVSLLDKYHNLLDPKAVVALDNYILRLGDLH